jgi:hypothetical protein
MLNRFCSICNRPVKLETSKTDELGKAVHEGCYLLQMSLKRTPPQPQRPAFPERIAISPITLNCPQCRAQPGQVCDIFDGEVEVVHVERIKWAAAMDVVAKKAEKH